MNNKRLSSDLGGRIGSGMRRLNLSRDIIFANIHASIGHLVRKVSLFVLPSLFRNFPVAVVRTRSTKLPYVVSSGIPPRYSMAKGIRVVALSSAPRR